jgi:hypothetical protein
MVAVGCEETNQPKAQDVSLIQLYKLEVTDKKGTFV